MLQELKREIRTYYGIEYALVHISKDGNLPSDKEDINPDQWWAVEHTKQSKRVSMWGGGVGFLWVDTASMKKARMKDKYHACEMSAVMAINWLMKDYHKTKTLFILRELKFYLYTSVRILPQSILFRIKKLIGTQS